MAEEDHFCPRRHPRPQTVHHVHRRDKRHRKRLMDQLGPALSTDKAPGADGRAVLVVRGQDLVTGAKGQGADQGAGHGVDGRGGVGHIDQIVRSAARPDPPGVAGPRPTSRGCGGPRIPRADAPIPAAIVDTPRRQGGDMPRNYRDSKKSCRDPKRTDPATPANSPRHPPIVHCALKIVHCLIRPILPYPTKSSPAHR